MTRALRDARQTSTHHKTNDTIKLLALCNNNITDDGAVALANAVQALLVMCASPPPRDMWL